MSEARDLCVWRVSACYTVPGVGACSGTVIGLVPPFAGCRNQSQSGKVTWKGPTATGW